MEKGGYKFTLWTLRIDSMDNPEIKVLRISSGIIPGVISGNLSGVPSGILTISHQEIF